MNVFLSIIVPVYNVEKYIEKCIDSILNQTFTDFELILVNDGSPDNCPQICDNYASKDKRIKVIHKENEGPVRARKTGIEVARGTYIGFVDCDDWIEYDMYEHLCNKAIKYNTDMVICDIIHEYSDKKIMSRQHIAPGLYDKSKMSKDVYPTMIFSGKFYEFGLHPSIVNKIFKSELVKRNFNNINEFIRSGEDAACTYSSLLEADSIYVLDSKYLYHYRQNESSVTHSYDEKFIDRILILNNLLREINSKNKIFDLSSQLDYYMVYLTMLAVSNEFNKLNIKPATEKIKQIRNLINIKDISKSISNISLDMMSFKLKIYTILLKNNNINILYLLISINNRIKNI